MDPQALMASRELGELPLSVGTSLAFESFEQNGFGKLRKIYVNLHTLLRNLHGACGKEWRDTISYEFYARTLLEELQHIQTFIQGIDGSVELVVYIPTYQLLGREFPRANVLETKTPLQKAYAGLSGSVMSAFLKNKPFPVVETKHHIPKCELSCGVITHHAVDLLSARSDTILIESHTGKHKRQVEWNTKLNGDGKSPRFPFCRLTLQVFGDGVDFGSNSYAMKKSLVALAEERKWNTATTDDRVAWSIRQMRDPVARTLFIDMS